MNLLNYESFSKNVILNLLKASTNGDDPIKFLKSVDEEKKKEKERQQRNVSLSLVLLFLFFYFNNYYEKYFIDASMSNFWTC